MFQKQVFCCYNCKKNLHGLDFYFDNTKNIATPKVPRINYHQTKIKTHQRGMKLSLKKERETQFSSGTTA